MMLSDVVRCLYIACIFQLSERVSILGTYLQINEACAVATNDMTTLHFLFRLDLRVKCHTVLNAFCSQLRVPIGPSTILELLTANCYGVVVAQSFPPTDARVFSFFEEFLLHRFDRKIHVSINDHNMVRGSNYCPIE